MQLRSRALAAARHIADELMVNDLDSLGGSLAGGHAGIALFFGHLHACAPEPRYGSRALDHLERAFASMPANPGISLFGGATGIAWSARHLAAGCLDVDTDALASFDDSLVASVEDMPDAWTLELVNGLAGVGLYAVSQQNSAALRRVLEHLVDRLEASCTDARDDSPWSIARPGAELDPQAEDETGFVNLGMAHGIPGVVLLLARALRAGVCVDRVRPLLRRAMDWLMAQATAQSQTALGHARYANWVKPGRMQPASPVAWCYGDLGISVAMLQAAAAAREPAWQSFGCRLALHAASHRGDAAKVADSGLCHGAAGNAHIFHRLHRVTGHTAFAQASDYWYGRTLHARRCDDGIGGYLTCIRRNDQPAWVPDPGLLMGASGIGLALLTLADGKRPGWDTSLGSDFE